MSRPLAATLALVTAKAIGKSVAIPEMGPAKTLKQWIKKVRVPNKKMNRLCTLLQGFGNSQPIGKLSHPKSTKHPPKMPRGMDSNGP